MKDISALQSAVCSMEEVVALEAKVKANVWILAPDIALGPQVFKSVMRDNMRDRGVKYRYLLSDDENTLENLCEFVSALHLEVAVSHFEIRLLPSPILEGDVTILDPNTPQEYAYVCSPCEVQGVHWRLVGSSLLRIKQRFTDLWRLGDPVVFDGATVAHPVKDKTPRGFLRFCWDHAVGPKGRILHQWEALGRKAVTSSNARGKDARQTLMEFLVRNYSLDRDLVPPFQELSYPGPLKETATRIQWEAAACHLAGASSASIGMCGKLLEMSLKYYWESKTQESLDANIGLGQLIKKVTETFSVQLDEGLKVLVNFINMYRIASVHHKKGFEVPTHEQSAAVLMMTYDTLRKLF